MSVTVSIDSNGKLVPMVHEERIPESVPQQIHQLKECGFHTAISLVRSNLVPVGHCPMPFQANAPETEITTMRSLVATLYFRHDVATWKRKGVDFSLYMYIPEVDPTTGKVHHKREDHCHILKRVAKHTREGEGAHHETQPWCIRWSHAGPQDRSYPHSTCWQSVTDAENLLFYHVSHFLQEKGYLADGRGMTQIQRCKANYAMLNYTCWITYSLVWTWSTWPIYHWHKQVN